MRAGTHESTIAREACSRNERARGPGSGPRDLRRVGGTLVPRIARWFATPTLVRVMPLKENISGPTPLDDLSGLIQKQLRTREQLDAAEAENIRKATIKYLAAAPTVHTAPFDYPWLLKLHREMYGDVWLWAGRLRLSQTNIGTLPQGIEVELHGLLHDLRAWIESQLPLLEQAVRLHHRAVLIHPFANGNGRWSRMLANIWLRRHGTNLIEWPETTVGSSSTIREEYLAALRNADRGDHAPLIALHERFRRSR